MAGAHEADQLMQDCAEALEAQGFVVNDRTCASQLKKVVGYCPRRSPARLPIRDVE